MLSGCGEFRSFPTFMGGSSGVNSGSNNKKIPPPPFFPLFIPFQEHPLGVIQVDPNDVFFAIHAVALTCITIIQCLIYEKGEQTVSRTCRFAIALHMLLLSL